MTPMKLPVALLALVAFVAVIPAWMWFIGEYTPQLPTETAWLVRFSLPAVSLLFVGSWLGGDFA
jgi:hypothetical protein